MCCPKVTSPRSPPLLPRPGHHHVEALDKLPRRKRLPSQPLQGEAKRHFISLPIFWSIGAAQGTLASHSPAPLQPSASASEECPDWLGDIWCSTRPGPRSGDMCRAREKERERVAHSKSLHTLSRGTALSVLTIPPYLINNRMKNKIDDVRITAHAADKG